MMADLTTFKDFVPRRGAAHWRALSEFDPSLQRHLQSSWIRESTAAEDSPNAADGTRPSPEVVSRDHGPSEDNSSSPDSPMFLHPDHTEILKFSVDEEDNELTDSSLPGLSLSEGSCMLDPVLFLDPRKDPRSPGSHSDPEVWQTKWHKCQVAVVSGEQFDSLLRRFPEFHSCKSHMAAFILQREVLDTAGGPCQHYSVVALGSGQTSVNKWLCYSGTMVQDCTAIAIARRALQRYLYKQLLVFFDPDPKSRDTSIFERREDCSQLQLKPKIHLHLYSNQPPNGGTKNFNFQRCSVGSICSSLKLQYHAKGLQIPASLLDPSIWGARVCCVSASDKLWRWAATGVQGALLSHFTKPIYITSMVLGRKSHSAEDISDIINRRLGEDWQLQLAAPYKRQDILVLCGDRVAPIVPLSRQQTLSLNWCGGDQEIEVLDGASGYIVDGSPSVSGPSFSSRLCKRALYSYFGHVVRRAGHTHLLELPTYHEVKMEAHPYQRAKNVVNQQFLFNQAGPWNSKHLVDCFSL